MTYQLSCGWFFRPHDTKIYFSRCLPDFCSWDASRPPRSGWRKAHRTVRIAAAASRRRRPGVRIQAARSMPEARDQTYPHEYWFMSLALATLPRTDKLAADLATTTWLHPDLLCDELPYFHHLYQRDAMPSDTYQHCYALGTQLVLCFNLSLVVSACFAIQMFINRWIFIRSVTCCSCYKNCFKRNFYFNKRYKRSVASSLTFLPLPRSILHWSSRHH